MPTGIATPYITVNNQVVNIVPNSFTYTEGLGEQSMKTQSAGGGQVSNVYWDNAETKFSTCKFKLFNTPYNIALSRQWKLSLNRNAISATGSTPDGILTKSFNNAALLNNYETALGVDGTIDLEFSSDKAV
jgi:hypothetical protein